MAFSLERSALSIFVYADESGVFDHVHNQIFVFGGVIQLTKSARDAERRKYISLEAEIRARQKATVHHELKASLLPKADKARLFRSLNRSVRFAVVIDQNALRQTVFSDKKTKQRYLDYAFKIGLKRAIEGLIREGLVDPGFSEALCVMMDEHTTATNGRYEMQEGLEAEFCRGTHNPSWQIFYPPVLPNASEVTFAMRDSQQDALIRAADIVANRVYHHAVSGTLSKISTSVRITHLP